VAHCRRCCPALHSYNCQREGIGLCVFSSITFSSMVMCPQVAGLWGNAQGVIRAAAQSVTETVEEGVRDVSSLHAVKAASGCAAAA
jgi:hypothetical protein